MHKITFLLTLSKKETILRRIFTLFALLSILSIPAYAEVRKIKTYQPLNPYSAPKRHSNYDKHYNQYNNPYNYDNIAAKRNWGYNNSRRNLNNRSLPLDDRSLTSVENRLLNSSYQYDTMPNRVARLEREMFGTIQSGDLNSRYNNLQQAMSNRNYYSQPTSKNFWSNVSNFFGGGSLTGFTAPIEQDSYGYQEAWRDSNGNYHQNFTDRNTSSGITILD